MNRMILKWGLALTALSGSLTAYAQSMTLPLLHIDTREQQAITSKTVYTSATFYIQDPDDPANDMGSAVEPLELEIRGRGNSSWKGLKKPYKIRLANKQSVLGMPKNRHWVLLNFGELNIAGMQLGNLLGMGWNPRLRPVELVLNGDYRGLYLISENVRIGSNRVQIYKQPDSNEDESTIPYGWLVEVDNYSGPGQIVFRENQKWNMNITYHSPDTLSDRQREWLLDEFKAMNEAVYATDKARGVWEDYLDADALARFFIAQEVMDNPDGFHGSFFLHKDLACKWVAGPLWDMNCLKREKSDYTFRMKASYAFTPHWIGELVKDGDFCEAVLRAWSDFYPDKVEEWMDYLDSVVMPCRQAYVCNHERWPTTDPTPLAEKLETLKSALRRNMEWFDEHLPVGEGTGANGVVEPRPGVVVHNLLGVKVAEADNYHDAVRGLPAGIYIVNGKKRFVR